MSLLKTSEGCFEQDHRGGEPLEEIKPNVATNLSRVSSLGKGFKTPDTGLQTHRDHRRNRPGLGSTQIARKAGLVRSM
jgi:hypothetical protein